TSLWVMEPNQLRFKGNGEIEQLVVQYSSTSWPGVIITVEGDATIDDIIYTGNYRAAAKTTSVLTLQGSGEVGTLTINDYGEVTINDGVVKGAISATAKDADHPIKVNGEVVSPKND
ncbi:MAG: hypothetical protein IJ800_04885, partial [Clostridia bacterium]|nr:hypothetical protein [Clostridia bacterium]